MTSLQKSLPLGFKFRHLIADMTRRITDSGTVVAFRDTASRFCRLVDSRNDHELSSLLRELESVLATLIADALALPEMKRFPSPYPGEDYDEDWSALYESLGTYFGRYDVFREVYDPYVNEEVLTGTISDAISGIYHDLSPGLRKWDGVAGSERRAIVWEWAFQFEIHWGHHAIDALRAFHSLLSTHRIGEPDHAWPPGQDE
jgi:hypothetical protein